MSSCSRAATNGGEIEQEHAQCHAAILRARRPPARTAPASSACSGDRALSGCAVSSPIATSSVARCAFDLRCRRARCRAIGRHAGPTSAGCDSTITRDRDRRAPRRRRRSRASGTARGSKKLPALYSFMPVTGTAPRSTDRDARPRSGAGSRRAACRSTSCTATDRTSRSATGTRVRSGTPSHRGAVAVRVRSSSTSDALMAPGIVRWPGGRGARATNRSRADARRRDRRVSAHAYSARTPGGSRAPIAPSRCRIVSTGIAPCWNRRLGKTGMSNPGDRLDAAPDDLALERVQRRHVVLRQRRERNRFGHLDRRPAACRG